MDVRVLELTRRTVSFLVPVDALDLLLSPTCILGTIHLQALPLFRSSCNGPLHVLGCQNP